MNLPRRWLKDDDPGSLSTGSARPGVFHSRVALTPDELRELQAGFERLIEPYANREGAALPNDAAPVRSLGLPAGGG